MLRVFALTAFLSLSRASFAKEAVDVTRQVALSTYAGAPLAADGSIDCGKLREALLTNGANSYNFLLEDKDGRSYLSTVRCLEALRNVRPRALRPAASSAACRRG